MRLARSIWAIALVPLLAACPIGDLVSGNDASPVDGSSIDGSGDGSSDADAAVVTTSCTDGGGMTNCGAAGNESCCLSLAVDGGYFYRDEDGVTVDAGYLAWVSSYRLDKYEVTVGRFRQFVNAVVAGWQPGAGSGIHTQLNDGGGLSAGTNAYEPGWDTSWPAMPTNEADWSTNLTQGCDFPAYATWTQSKVDDAREKIPIDCLTWFEAYAFCIWDGGFLPSDAEWNYAGAGGGGTDGQRVYPWSIPSTDTTNDCAHANTNVNDGGCGAAPVAVGSTSPAGDGRFGQADLAGNVAEWSLDFHGVIPLPCTDCVSLTGQYRIDRGGGFRDDVHVAQELYANPASRRMDVGVRCARAP